MKKRTAWRFSRIILNKCRLVTAATVVAKCCSVAATTEDKSKYNKDNNPIKTTIVVTSEHRKFSFLFEIFFAGKTSLHYIYIKILSFCYYIRGKFFLNYKRIADNNIGEIFLS